MFGRAKRPLDRTPYPRSAESRPLTIAEHVGCFIFAVDTAEVIYVMPDRLHGHPLVLGRAESALYAGELAISQPGVIAEVTNCSGTFRFKSQRSLCCVAARLRSLGFLVTDIVWFPPDGNSYPLRLQCD